MKPSRIVCALTKSLYIIDEAYQHTKVIEKYQHRGKQAVGPSFNWLNRQLVRDVRGSTGSGQRNRFDCDPAKEIGTAIRGQQNDRGKAVIECFKYGEPGHVSTECKKQIVSVAKNTPANDDDDEEATFDGEGNNPFYDGKPDNDGDNGVMYGDGGRSLVIRKTF